VEIALWGTRGSLAAPGPDTARYGGNTSCVHVHDGAGTHLILDAGTGIRRLGGVLPPGLRRVDLLLTHLHLDHIQGLGFFTPLYDPGMELHVWGPASPTLSLRERLMRYLSPPLFPLHLRDVPCRLHLHEVPRGPFAIGGFQVNASLVCHPGPTVGYRIADRTGCLAYLPDHEPALGSPAFPGAPDWTSGFALAEGADLLIHDAQYTPDEYAGRIGWGHSAIPHALRFAELAGARRLVAFHHDPAHDDDTLDRIWELFLRESACAVPVSLAREGERFLLPRPRTAGGCGGVADASAPQTLPYRSAS